MENAQEDPTADLEDAEPLGLSPARMRSLANLRPAWTSESAPRLGGRLPDGTSTRSVPMRKELERQLKKRRTMRRLVETWIESAIDGDAQAREQILKRLDPILEDQAQGRQILEGLSLELTHRGVKLTALSSAQSPREAEVLEARAVPAQDLRAAESVGVPEGDAHAPGIQHQAPGVLLEPSQKPQESQESPSGQ